MLSSKQVTFNHVVESLQSLVSIMSISLHYIIIQQYYMMSNHTFYLLKVIILSVLVIKCKEHQICHKALHELESSVFI